MGIADLDEAQQERDRFRLKDNEIGRLKRANGKLSDENAEMRTMLDRYSTIKAQDAKTPKWLTPKRKTKAHTATAVLLLSDLHLDEVVDLHEMDGLNEYDRATAHARFERVINKTPEMLKHYSAGVHYDGIVVPLLGDTITGVIHDELERTNEAPPSASIAHWVPHLASGLSYLADELDHLFVPCVDGNHDRFYKKTPKKQRATSSLAWIIYNWLADHLRDDKRIQFGISTSPEQLIDVYDTTLLLTHGDGFRSAGGVGGLYPSLMKFMLRSHDLYSSQKRDFDYALMGHWHSPLWGQDFVVNGSIKGYDEYAKDSKFKFSRPSQQLFTITPEYGIDMRREVFAT